MCAKANTWTSSKLSYIAEELSPPSLLLPPPDERGKSGSSVGDEDREQALMLRRDLRRVETFEEAELGEINI